MASVATHATQTMLAAAMVTMVRYDMGFPFSGRPAQ
jgi:hypothetical protein